MESVWWKDAIGYQIYIRSFKDSNDDGIGDIKGIIEKLDYIQSLGVDFIWICPFYDSPMDDNGYDIRNYYKIAEEYGNMNDLKLLIKTAHKKGIKVITDLVLNHTSNENKWFINSENKIAPYTDFYIWRDGKVVDGKMCPPNNWQSFFSGSAWGYSDKRKQYYLKIFSNTMPDINYESETAFSEMEKVIDYFGKLGVDGFRVDAISHIGKDLTFADAKDINKTYKSFSNRANNHKYLARLHKSFAKHNLVTMGELGGSPTKKDLVKYTTNNELDMIFSFEQVGVFNDDFLINGNNLINTLKYKHLLTKHKGWPVLFWLNHDYPRLFSKIRGEKDAKNAQICLATLMYMLKGTPIIYNGEEIGMTNYQFKSVKEFKDVNAKMIFANAENIDEEFEKLKEISRDNSRTMMQWDTSKNAGFSSGKPWGYVNKNYKKVNVEASALDENSILNNYIKILSVRKDCQPYISYGKYKFFNKKGLLGYKICCKDCKIVVVANFSNFDKQFLLNNEEILYTNMKKNQILKPYQVAIIKAEK